MKKTRLWMSTAVATAIALGGILLAVPAQAVPAGNIVDNGNGTATVSWSGFASASAVKIQLGCSGAGTPCYSLSPNLTSGSALIIEGLSVTSGLSSVPLPAGEYVIRLMNVTTVVQQSSGTITIGSGGGTSSDSAPSAPVEASLSLDLAASGASCASGSAATGVVGTWLSLPGADDCTSTTAPSAKLLGWATRADFPVAIAQRQIDNGWGAYELFNDEGRMTAVFIPAGGATFVSASTSLHPIWAS